MERVMYLDTHTHTHLHTHLHTHTQTGSPSAQSVTLHCPPQVNQRYFGAAHHSLAPYAASRLVALLCPRSQSGVPGAEGGRDQLRDVCGCVGCVFTAACLVVAGLISVLENLLSTSFHVGESYRHGYAIVSQGWWRWWCS